MHADGNENKIENKNMKIYFAVFYLTTFSTLKSIIKKSTSLTFDFASLKFKFIFIINIAPFF